jgi:hypothetical protein
VSWPIPRPGLVIRYAYLWRREAEAGQEEGLKDRPCAVVVAIKTEDDETMVYVLPITHSPPRDPDDAVELPLATKYRLGLDGERSWVVISEGNSFIWPGPDLRPAPGRGPESVAYGFLPRSVFDVIRQRFLARVRERRAGVTGRGE